MWHSGILRRQNGKFGENPKSNPYINLAIQDRWGRTAKKNQPTLIWKWNSAQKNGKVLGWFLKV